MERFPAIHGAQSQLSAPVKTKVFSSSTFLGPSTLVEVLEIYSRGSTGKRVASVSEQLDSRSSCLNVPKDVKMHPCVASWDKGTHV